MLDSQLDSIIFWTFAVNLVLTFIIMLRKKIINKTKTPEELSNLLTGIFTVNVALMFSIHLQLPYRYQLYLENGLTHSTISKVMCYHHICSGIWSIFLPFAIKKLGHKILMIIAAICQATSSFILGSGQGNMNSFIIATCISGLTMPTLMRCFQDIWQLEERVMPSEWNANYVFNEARSFISLIITWITSPLSSLIVSNYGVSSIFSLTPGISIAAIVAIIYLVQSPNERIQRQQAYLQNKQGNKGEDKAKNAEKKAHFNNKALTTNAEDMPKAIAASTYDEQMSIWSEIILVKRHLCERKITFFVILLDVTFQVGFFLFMQRKSAFLLTPQHKPPMGYVSGSLGVLDLTGAQVISMFASAMPYKVWLGLSTFAVGILSLAVYFMYTDKFAVFILLCINAFIHSTITTNLFFLHKEYFPSHLRNYFISLTRLPTSIISVLVMWFWKTENIESYSLVAGFCMLACSLMFFILVAATPKQMDQSDEKKLLDTEDDLPSPSLEEEDLGELEKA